LFREVNLPTPIKNEKNQQNKIYINNKTGRKLIVTCRQALRPKYLQKIGATAGFSPVTVGINADKAEYTRCNISDPSTIVIKPNGKQEYVVREDCEGINFDFLCLSDATNGLALNYFISKGYTQELLGQPEKLEKKERV
jgi:hypothetical protein